MIDTVKIAQYELTPNNTNRADIRIGFERWYSGDNTKCPSIRRDSNGDYTLMQAHLAWLAWQAAIQWSKYD